jgi:hypothetical protein
MLDDVADVSVATEASGPRSPDTRGALRYLACSGVRAISITDGPGGVVIAVGIKINPAAAAVYWMPAAKARSIAARARKIAGDAVDVEAVVAALHEAATELRATLTPHDVALARAADAAEPARRNHATPAGDGRV